MQIPLHNCAEQKAIYLAITRLYKKVISSELSGWIKIIPYALVRNLHPLSQHPLKQLTFTLPQGYTLYHCKLAVMILSL